MGVDFTQVSSGSIVAPQYLSGVYEAWQPKGFQYTTANSMALSATGKLSEMLALTTDRTGKFEPIMFELVVTPPKNEALIALLSSWITEYGDQADPDLAQQQAELQQHRLHFKSS